MRFQSSAAAIDVLHDPSRPEAERTAAVHSLARDLNPNHINILAQTLGDESYAVRWAASNALIHAGSAAYRPVLRVLVSQGAEAAVREAACHALCENVDPQVRAASQELITAIQGPGADVATPQHAFELLRSAGAQPS